MKHTIQTMYLVIPSSYPTFLVTINNHCQFTHDTHFTFRQLDGTPCHLAKQALITILTIFVDASLVCSVHSSRLHFEGVSFCGFAARAFVTAVTYQMGFALLAVRRLGRCVVTRLSKLVCKSHAVFPSD